MSIRAKIPLFVDHIVGDIAVPLYVFEKKSKEIRVDKEF